MRDFYDFSYSCYIQNIPRVEVEDFNCTIEMILIELHTEVMDKETWVGKKKSILIFSISPGGD